MGQDQQSLFADKDGLFEDDRAVHQTLLRSRYACFHRLDTVVSHLEPSALENPLVTSRNVNLGRMVSKMAELLVLFVFPLVPRPDLRLVKSIVLLLLVIGTLVGLGAGFPSWIWMMP